MLVIVSDLHFCDSPTASAVPASTFREFHQRLRDMAYDASWRRDGKYRPIEEIDIVLMGDILDLLHSERWPFGKTEDKDYVRPWSDADGPLLPAKVGEIVDGILERNAEAISVIRGFSAANSITIPPATEEDKPARVSFDPESADRAAVKVRTHYMVGNHDWLLHLPGTEFNTIRARIASAMGLVQTADAPFPHDPAESPALSGLAEKHRTWFRHGDIYDPMTFERERNRASIGDAIVIDLLERFTVTLRQEMGDELPEAWFEGLTQVRDIRPLLLVPVWVNGLLRRTCSNSVSMRKVKTIWDRLVDELIHSPYGSMRKPFLPPHLLEKIDNLLRFSGGSSISSLAEMYPWFRNSVRVRNDRPTYQDAIGERAFKTRTAATIIYGHAHHPEIVPLNLASSGGNTMDQNYINCGTWRPVYEQTRLNTTAELFHCYWTMSYVALFCDDERSGRSCETWQGAILLPR